MIPDTDRPYNTEAAHLRVILAEAGIHFWENAPPLSRG